MKAREYDWEAIMGRIEGYYREVWGYLKSGGVI